MKIGIYDPYLDTLGGGERYVAQIAKCLSSHDVTIFWDDDSILERIEKRFGLSLPSVKVSSNIFSENVSLRSRLMESRRYSVIFFISDGSFPFLLANKVFPILQFPISIDRSGIKNSLKFRKISLVICYSEFVKNHLKDTFPANVTVINPAVSQIGAGKKEKIILSVGRFTRGKNEKNQEVMIDFYKEHHGDFKGWKLILAGGVLPKDEGFVDSLKEKAKGFNIEIIPNVTFPKLRELYKSSKIYWHAAGFGRDIALSPESAEHFGITTVEAMGAGSVPVVFAGGGLTEIVQDGENGYLWSDLKGLLKKTLKLTASEKEWETMSKKSVKRASDFSEDKFCDKINKLITTK